MLRMLLCGWLALASPCLGAQETPKEKVKDGVQSAKKAVGEAGRKVGQVAKEGAQAAKTGAKKVGETAKKVAEDIKDGVKQAVQEIKGTPKPE